MASNAPNTAAQDAGADFSAAGAERRARRVRRRTGTTWAALPEPHRRVLAMRERGHTFAEIGRSLGVSRQRAHEIARVAREMISGQPEEPESP